jgi:ABC-type branched-subunit amino acid transport system ATPase component
LTDRRRAIYPPEPKPFGMSTLELQNITKDYRGVQALGGVDLALSKGEIVGLIGPNGSGKTTLMGIASGVLKPTSGDIVVGGRRATGRPPERFARLGVGRTFQQIRLFPDLTVHETVSVGAISRGRPVSEVGDVLERFGLTEHAERLAATLPYGLQRRVEIARAMAGRPQFLLLDEPAAGMNEAESDELLDTLRSCRDGDGCGTLVVDHDLRLIMRLCDRIVVLAQGRLIAQGTPEEVRRDPEVIAAYLGTAAAAAA